MRNTATQLSLAALLIATLTLAGCGDSGGGAGTANNSGSDFSITYPENWLPIPGLPAVVKSAKKAPLDSSGDTFHENVNVITEPVPSGVSLDAYLDKNLELMKANLGGFNLGNTSDSKLGGQPAKRVVYQHNAGASLKVLAYVSIKNGEAFIVTCSSENKSYAEYEPEFEKIAATFKFE